MFFIKRNLPLWERVLRIALGLGIVWAVWAGLTAGIVSFIARSVRCAPWLRWQAGCFASSSASAIACFAAKNMPNRWASWHHMTYLIHRPSPPT